MVAVIEDGEVDRGAIMVGGEIEDEVVGVVGVEEGEGGELEAM